MSKLTAVLDEIDIINQKDPRETIFDGSAVAQEYLYGLRMTEMLQEYEPDAQDLLQIAARGQHIRRWAIARKEFPMDRKGYLQWRTKLKLMHADLLAEIMDKHGYADDEVAKVRILVSKQKLKTDEDSQKLEDVACLVFLKYYFESFAKEHPEPKVVSILRKTWKKMTDKGKEMALNLNLSEESKALVSMALSEQD